MISEHPTVGLVACASQKLQRPAPARELYVSQLFKKASAYAGLTCDRWYILSAKHGLVHPDTVLEPTGIPTLRQNYAHVLEIVASEP